MKTSNISVYSLCVLVLGLLGTEAANAQSSDPQMRVIFFIPSDVAPPEGVPERLKEYVDYSQNFFKKWMDHWDYPSAVPMPVERDENGYPKILYVRGEYDEASGKYSKVGFQSEAVAKACEKYDIDPAGQVWWIFTYKGPASRGFRGGGNARRGGTSTSIYEPSDQGHLRLEDELGDDEQMRLKSKGSIHELGHAFGLPHIGPIEHLNFGNSLMGPIIRAYRNQFPGEDRVYLTEASAAMLYKHPLFSGTSEGIEETPKLKFDDLEFVHDRESAKIVVTGKIRSGHSAHSVIVANESKLTKSPYWQKCFVGRVGEGGSFTVELDELNLADGQMRMVACFNNGTIIGRTPGLGLNTGFVRKYQYKSGEFVFNDKWEAQVLPAGQRRRGPNPN